MLLKDFLAETAPEQRELELLARRIYRRYQSQPQREYDLGGMGSWEEPAIEALVGTLKVKFDSRFDRSLYNPKTKEVLINPNDKNIESVLVHELQHALDDFKSQGQFRREKGSYLTRQSEVNARLTQAMADINQALKQVQAKNIDWQNPKMRSAVEKLIASYLKKHQLTPQQGIEVDRYQRLLKRIYNYILNH